MKRYETMFEKLNKRNEGAMVPFVMMGDPSLEDTLAIIDALIKGGADALELGFPFSDPVADGPTIAASAARALNSQVTTRACFDLLFEVRRKHPDIPIGLLVYANLVVAAKPEEFYWDASKAGVDSVLVADVPVFEAESFVNKAKSNGIQPILIAPPNADKGTLRAVAKFSRGYTYVVARKGVTGANDEKLQLENTDLFKTLKSFNAPPALVGFGISKQNHVKQAIEAGASGVIVGSAIVNLIEKYQGTKALLPKLEEFVCIIKSATKSTGFL